MVYDARAGGEPFLAFTLVMVPIGDIGEFGVGTVIGHFPWQPDLMRVIGSVFGAYIDMTALTILSAVVFQGFQKPVEPVRTP